MSRKLTLHLENVTANVVIEKISTLSGLNFSYASNVIDTVKKISFSVKNKTLKQTLDKLTSQLGLRYLIVENQIILKNAKPGDTSSKTTQERSFTISGFIRDKASGESLIGATVFVAGTNTGVITNPYGFYSLTLPPGDYTIVFSYIGYGKKEFSISLTDDTQMSIALEPDTKTLGEVTVIADRKMSTLQKSQMSETVIKPKSLNNMPEFAGEVGLIKTLQTLPGIKTHSDGSSFFFVRGGNKDQNLVLIDDAPVFNHAHLFGYYSAINPDVAQDIKVYSGDMPVGFGDRLSSVIDIHTKQGNLNHFEINGMLNPLIYGLSTEGPVIKGKSSFFLSFRHSNFSWIYKRNTPNLVLYLYDINAKLNFKLNNNNRLFFSFYTGKDNIQNRSPSDFGGIGWENFAASIRWNHIFNKKLFMNLIIASGLYNYDLSSYKSVWNSSISNTAFKTDFTWYITPENTMRFGYNLNFHKFNPGNLSFENTSLSFTQVPRKQSNENVFYWSGELAIAPALSLKAGFRVPIWTNTGPATVYLFDESHKVIDTLNTGTGSYISFINFDPRLSLKFKISENSSLKLSYGIYHQYLQMLSNSISPFSSFEVWLPAGKNIMPQRADQIATGVVTYFEKVNLELTSEFYYKMMKNQIDYKPHASLLLNPLIEGELRFGSAVAYGAEFMLKRTQGKITGWLSYTWSRIFKTIDGINGNERFPAFYDRPHDFSIYINWQLSSRSSLSATWIYYTGSAITTPAGFYDYNGHSVPIYEEKNNDRLPDYHRLDISFNWRLNKKTRRFEHHLSFGIYNLYARNNPVSINFNKIEDGSGNFVVPVNVYGNSPIVTTQKYLMGFMPSITYKFNIKCTENEKNDK